MYYWYNVNKTLSKILIMKTHGSTCTSQNSSVQGQEHVIFPSQVSDLPAPLHLCGAGRIRFNHDPGRWDHVNNSTSSQLNLKHCIIGVLYKISGQ